MNKKSLANFKQCEKNEEEDKTEEIIKIITSCYVFDYYYARCANDSLCILNNCGSVIESNTHTQWNYSRCMKINF